MLALLMLPSVLLGPSLTQAVMLLHVHGPQGQHQHLLSSISSAHDLDEFHDWHAGTHTQPSQLDVPHTDGSQHDSPSESWHAHDHGSLNGHVPPGLVIEFDLAAWTRANDGQRTAVDTVLELFTLTAAEVWPTITHSDQADPLFGLAAELPPPGDSTALPVPRSGTLRLLRSNHALLI